MSICRIRTDECHSFASPCFAPKFPSVIDVHYQQGVYLPKQDFWLDPPDAKPFAFVSHAHSDHLAPHEEIIVSKPTAALMRKRIPGIRTQHLLPFYERQM